MRNRIFSALAMTSLVIILLALFLKTLGIFDDNVKTYPAKLETLKLELEKDAYIFRDEMIIGAVDDGQVEYYVEEGERVYAGQPLASQSLEKLPIEYDESGNKKSYVLDSAEEYMIDLGKIQSNIYSLEDELSYLVAEQRLAEVEDVKERLSSLYLIQSAFKNSESSALNKPHIEATRDGSRYVYYAPVPGLIGLEQSVHDQLFHINNMHLLSYQNLNDLEPSVFLREVHKSQGFIRIVDNKESYIVVQLSEGEQSLFEEGTLCTIKINDSYLTVENYQFMRTEQQLGIVFRCFEDYPGLTSSRFEKISVIPEETEGIYVKTKSIVEIDGQAGVYVLKNNGKKVFMPIKIKGHLGEEAVVYSDYFTVLKSIEGGEPVSVSIETISLYDEIVEEP